MTAINIRDKDESPEQTLKVVGTGGGQLIEIQVEQPNATNLEEPKEVERQQQEEPKMKELKPEEPRLVEQERNEAREQQQEREQH